MPPILHSHLKGNFSLDSSGIAGFFGGEEAFAAMNSLHLVPARRWLGWYNSPGSYFVARKYGVLPDSLFWDGLFPGESAEPAELLELDSDRKGLRYTGVYSGTQLSASGHLSYLLSRHCKNAPSLDKSKISPLQVVADHHTPVLGTKRARQTRNANEEQQAQHRNISVVIMNFTNTKLDNPSGSKLAWPNNAVVPESDFTSMSNVGKTLLISTILFSFAGAILSALYGDWFSFSMILYGSLANGVTSLILGMGILCLEVTSPSKESPPGDGVLFDGHNIIILRGSERVVSTILQARYHLRYEHDQRYFKIGLCSIALLAQFLLQLLLIPQGKLIGQIFFLSTLAMSWICNGYLASLDRKKIQADLLFKLIGTPTVFSKIVVDKWSVAVAFSIFYFGGDATGILDEIMPNNTPAWNTWKKCIREAATNSCKPSETETARNGINDDKDFVRNFLQYADDAYEGVTAYRKNVPEDTVPKAAL